MLEEQHHQQLATFLQKLQCLCNTHDVYQQTWKYVGNIRIKAANNNDNDDGITYDSSIKTAITKTPKTIINAYKCDSITKSNDNINNNNVNINVNVALLRSPCSLVKATTEMKQLPVRNNDNSNDDNRSINVTILDTALALATSPITATAVEAAKAKQITATINIDYDTIFSKICLKIYENYGNFPLISMIRNNNDNNKKHNNNSNNNNSHNYYNNTNDNNKKCYQYHKYQQYANNINNLNVKMIQSTNVRMALIKAVAATAASTTSSSTVSSPTSSSINNSQITVEDDGERIREDYNYNNRRCRGRLRCIILQHLHHCWFTLHYVKINANIWQETVTITVTVTVTIACLAKQLLQTFLIKYLLILYICIYNKIQFLFRRSLTVFLTLIIDIICFNVRWNTLASAKAKPKAKVTATATVRNTTITFYSTKRVKLKSKNINDARIEHIQIQQQQQQQQQQQPQQQQQQQQVGTSIDNTISNDCCKQRNCDQYNHNHKPNQKHNEIQNQKSVTTATSTALIKTTAITTVSASASATSSLPTIVASASPSAAAVTAAVAARAATTLTRTMIATTRTKTPKAIITTSATAASTATTSATTATTTTTTITPTLRHWQCSFVYTVVLLLTAILILPECHYRQHLASAAKPKSATQFQRNQQQQQQQQQQSFIENQQHTKIAYAAGDDNLQFGSDGILLLTAPPSYQMVSLQSSNEEQNDIDNDDDVDTDADSGLFYPSSQFDEHLFHDDKLTDNFNGKSDNELNTDYDSSNQSHFNDTTIMVVKTPLFPTDLFTKEQLERGAVICHIIGVIYMFVALAIVCDEFFVPSLDVIIEKLGITDDVAGATFMAAGGSAPELFTSVIGVFVSFDDVGIGTIVGSAVFNILFVIGMCALFSRTVLSLTWWPLFRDCTFYSISLMILIYFFRDNLIYWWEALILFTIYIAYVTFMKWNVEVETCVKNLISKNKVTRVRSTDQLMPAGNAANSSETSMATQPGGSVTSRAASETRSGPPGSSSGAAAAGCSGPGTTGNSSGGNTSSTQTGAKFRHGLLQLMIHTIDPLHDGKVDEKATQLHAIASLKVLLDATKPQRGGATTSAANHVKINLKETALADRPNGNIDTTLDSPSLSGRRPSWIDQRVKIQTRKFSIKQPQIEIEDEPEPLSMAWPDTARKRLTYIVVAPLLIPMWLTLPDTRTPKGKRYFPITFIGSIVWIAAFSYLMVWWANVAGDTARIPPEVMGLTFLAAGTSIPDLITSVIVARKGFGDMAVSSSVGSNIFDVTVGLPIPWLLYGIFYDAPVEVNSVGMVCSITILFMMLIFVVMSIACFHWRMNKGLGFTMFLLYFVFVAVSLMFEYDVITCPV